MIRLYAKKQLARKYARAFLRTFEVTQDCLFTAIEKLSECLTSNQLAFHTLILSSARIEDRCEGLKILLKKFKIPKEIHQLIEVMLRQKKLDLLPFLLPALQEEFRKKTDQQEVYVTSAHSLTQQDRKRLEKGIQAQIAGTLSFVYAEDPSLVAGLKIQTPTYYWEKSLARTIRTLEHRLRLQEKI